MKGKSICLVFIVLAIGSGVILKTPVIKNAKPLDVKNINVSKEDIVKGIDRINSFANTFADNTFNKVANTDIKQVTNQLPIDIKIDSKQLVKADLVRVVDGDTIVVLIDGAETKIRLIGMDTPESVSSDESKNNEYGDMASEYTKSILSNYTSVYLQYDITRTDIYDRTLAYVWLKEDVEVSNTEHVANYMLNGIVVNNGYAKNKVYMPNIKYADVFEQLCNDAQSQKRGLWQYDEYENL